ncbi:MAG: DNA photolyase family protein [Gammaproteobacteria bacterium]|nr:DNA photolyase family protein [Gammaproteobacteria bacterium]MDH3465162.1 DNA photolyase family protein [Gammaproteobacteria bacterium]
MTTPTIMWFRQDLRLADNPALHAACKRGAIIPVYILDDIGAAEWKMGGASRWWLHHSLTSLQHSLDGCLNLYLGDPLTVLTQLAEETQAQAVFWNRCYEPWRISRDSHIKSRLSEAGVDVQSFNGSLLWEPWEVLKQDGSPYKVFTPYYRNGCLKRSTPRAPLPEPCNMDLAAKRHDSLLVDELGLLPDLRWDKKLEGHWTIGEAGAKDRLDRFISQGIEDYKAGRNFPDKPYVSRLSPALHFGEISPNSAWHASAEAAVLLGRENDLDTFHSELGWREFSYYLLYHFPKLPTANLQSRFDRFPWVNQSNSSLEAWQNGMTGYPIVDAGMRELWETGYMHNRVRMIVGSFLVKNLRIHWRQGANWFWDCLADADLASNSASWQWIAGCGADAAPFFRIFNPVTQSRKFDADGNYIRRYIPELAALPAKYSHAPWETPADILDNAGITLGKDYPKPIVDLIASRQWALQAFKSTKENGSRKLPADDTGVLEVPQL